MIDEFKVYSTEEVQEILKVTQRTLYNYIKEGKLRATKIGKYWRVKHNDLHDFINRGTNKPE